MPPLPEDCKSAHSYYYEDDKSTCVLPVPPFVACCELISNDGHATVDVMSFPSDTRYRTNNDPQQWFNMVPYKEYKVRGQLGGHRANFLQGCPNLKYITVLSPYQTGFDEVTSLPQQFLAGTPNLEHVEMINVHNAEDRAFADCPKLRTINAPHLKEIHRDVFAGATSLIAANFPNVETVWQNAFEGTTSLCKLDFPKAKTRKFVSCSADLATRQATGSQIWAMSCHGDGYAELLSKAGLNADLTQAKIGWNAAFAPHAFSGTSLQCLCYPPEAVNEATSCDVELDKFLHREHETDKWTLSLGPDEGYFTDSLRERLKEQLQDAFRNSCMTSLVSFSAPGCPASGSCAPPAPPGVPAAIEGYQGKYVYMGCYQDARDRDLEVLAGTAPDMYAHIHVSFDCRCAAVAACSLT